MWSEVFTNSFLPPALNWAKPESTCHNLGGLIGEDCKPDGMQLAEAVLNVFRFDGVREMCVLAFYMIIFSGTLVILDILS